MNILVWCVIVLALVGAGIWIGWNMGVEHAKFEQAMREIPARMSGEVKREN